MAKVKHTKKPKKRLPTLSEIKASPSILTRTRLAAKRQKAREHTGLTSTPKTSRSCLEGLTIRSEPKMAIEASEWKGLEDYRKAAVELYWKCKAQEVIIQNLLSRMTLYGYRISGNLTESTLNITKSFSTKDAAPTTSETGQSKTFSKNSGLIDDYKLFRTTTLPAKLTGVPDEDDYH